MSTIALDSNNDWDITGGKLTLLTGPAADAQKIAARLRFFKGEWFLDLRQGMPYFEAFLVKNPDIDALTQIVRRVILETQGVASVDSLVLSWDRKKRKLTYTFQAKHDSGATIQGGEGKPFIIEDRQ